MNKKIGPLPLWAWGAIALAVGYGIYRLQRGGSEEDLGVEESLFPTQGIPIEEREGGGGEGGLGSLGETLQQLQELGFSPPGSEAGEERREAHEEAREVREEGFIERAEIRREQFEKWAAEFARSPAKAAKKAGKAAGKAAGKTANKAGKVANKAGHVHTPGHAAAKAPKARIPNGGPGRNPRPKPHVKQHIAVAPAKAVHQSKRKRGSH